MIGAKQQRGFTLLEMIIATSLFVTFMVAATGLFIMTNNRNNKLWERYNIAQQTKFMMEQIARDAKTMRWNYEPGVWPQAGPNSELRLMDEDGSSVTYRFGFTPECGDCLQVKHGAGNWEAMHLAWWIQTTGSAFYISPTTNPFALDELGRSASDEQPQVTIFLKTQQQDRPEISLMLQTTITSRRYVR